LKIISTHAVDHLVRASSKLYF